MEIRKETAYAIGFLTNLNSPDFFNYLNELLEQDEIDKCKSLFLSMGMDEFVVLKHLGVESEADRGKGLGSFVLSEFLKSTNLSVVLMSDNFESQKEGFNLQDFYERKGFELIPVRGKSGPIMVYRR